MPTYLYRLKGNGGGTFEIRQSIHDAALTRHPQTGEAIERVLTAPAIISGKLGDAAIANSGLKKYTRTSDGTYEGPED